MAKIKDAHPKKSSGGYQRLVDNSKLAEILIKAQSTVISNGTELEKIISSRARLIKDLDAFILDVKAGKIQNGTYLCLKKTVKNSAYRMDRHEPDFMVFVVNRDRLCNVIELKDGDSFDTKKSTSELESLQAFTSHIAPQIPFMVRFYICCFNQDSKDNIISGFKNRFTEDQVLTGKEFCDLLGIDYDSIVSSRTKDAKENFNYILEEMSNMPEMIAKVQKQSREHIDEREFYSSDGGIGEAKAKEQE